MRNLRKAVLSPTREVSRLPPTLDTDRASLKVDLVERQPHLPEKQNKADMAVSRPIKTKKAQSKLDASRVMAVEVVLADEF